MTNSTAGPRRPEPHLLRVHAEERGLVRRLHPGDSRVHRLLRLPLVLHHRAARPSSTRTSRTPTPRTSAPSHAGLQLGPEAERRLGRRDHQRREPRAQRGGHRPEGNAWYDTWATRTATSARGTSAPRSAAPRAAVEPGDRAPLLPPAGVEQRLIGLRPQDRLRASAALPHDHRRDPDVRARRHERGSQIRRECHQDEMVGRRCAGGGLLSRACGMR